ncbi:hypothetical protein L3X07_13365 [Levilactobacillus brevis]|nr:hypothetical protein [Levilactobacillus brevis]
MAHTQHQHSLTRELACINQVPIFQHLSDEQKVSVAQVTRPVHAAKGETVFAMGRFPRRCTLLTRARYGYII